jgi:predicted DNA-binding protein YlxM (UPF0122 family)
MTHKYKIYFINDNNQKEYLGICYSIKQINDQIGISKKTIGKMIQRTYNVYNEKFEIEKIIL